MRNPIATVLLLALGAVGCAGHESDGCKTDLDCKGDRICDAATLRCVDPKQGADLAQRDSNAAGDMAASFASVQTILTRSCALSASCHQSAVAQTGNLKLAAGSAYCSLLGAAGGATYRAAAQMTFPRRVVVGSRQRSFLYKKLILTDAEMGPDKDLGSRMPVGAMLDPDEIDLFGRWIDAGAPGAGGEMCP